MHEETGLIGYGFFKGGGHEVGAIFSRILVRFDTIPGVRTKQITEHKLYYAAWRTG